MTSVTPLHDNAPEESSRIDVIPQRAVKTIHLIRHGMGYHNEATDEADYLKEEYFDSSLNEIGWAQSHALNAHISNLNLQVDLVVVSPLRRALETAAGAFGLNVMPDCETQRPMMSAQDAEMGKQVAHAEIACHNAPSHIALELVRETLGVHPCDRRRTIQEQAADFPGVDFTLIEHDEDVYWDPEVRESPADIQARGRKFARWLMGRSESSIAVVAHSGFIYGFCQNFGHSLSNPLKEELHSHFKNCEMRSFNIFDTSIETASADEAHFAGGKLIECAALD